MGIMVEEKNAVRFGDLIAKARKEKEYSLQQVSDLLDNEVTPSYMSRLENKKQENPSFSVVCGLVQVLDIPFHEVLIVFGFETLAEHLFQNNRKSVEIVIKSDENKELAKFGQGEGRDFLEEESLGEIICLLLQYVYSESERHYGYLPKILEKIESMRNNHS